MLKGGVDLSSTLQMHVNDDVGEMEALLVLALAGRYLRTQKKNQPTQLFSLNSRKHDV